MARALRAFLGLVFRPVQSGWDVVIDIVTVGGPAAVAGFFARNLPWMVVAGLGGLGALLLVAGVRLQRMILPNISCEPDARWEHIYVTKVIPSQRETFIEQSPAMFAGLRVTNLGLPQTVRAQVIYADGTDARDWPPPWEQTGEEHQTLGQQQSRRLLLFAVREAQDGRWLVRPFRIGLDAQGHYRLQNEYAMDKPFRVVVRLWDEGGGYTECELLVGINGDGSPIKQLIKECQRVIRPR